MRFGRTKKYRIPEDLIRHLCGFADPVVVRKVVRNLELMGWREPMRVGFEGVDSDDEIEDPIIDVAREIAKSDLAPHFVGSVVQASGAAQGPGVEIARQKILDEYKDSVFNTEIMGPPPVRGPFGEATIVIKPGTSAVKQRMYQIHGERREKWAEIITSHE